MVPSSCIGGRDGEEATVDKRAGPSGRTYPDGRNDFDGRSHAAGRMGG